MNKQDVMAGFIFPHLIKAMILWTFDFQHACGNENMYLSAYAGTIFGAAVLEITHLTNLCNSEDKIVFENIYANDSLNMLQVFLKK